MRKSFNKFMKLNKFAKVSIVLGILIVTTIGFSYAYFQLGLHAEQITTIQVGIEEMEKFTYNSGETLLINNDNVTDTTNPTATLIPGTSEILIQSTYDVYFQTVDNTFFYTTEAKDAELILTITDPAGNVITEADGLNYVTSDGGVSGFDITEFWGFVPIKLDYPISSQDKINGTTQTWSATVTFVDLPGEQIVPEGSIREFEGVIILKNGDIKGLNEQIIEAGGGVEYIESKPIPTYASGEYIYTGLYAAPDDYGTTYYFRGSGVNNNFVEFSGHLWEIIRINGDGSVRMLYAEDTAAGSSAYNTKNFGYGEAVGYVYTPGIAHGVEVDSNLKIYLDNWYVNDSQLLTNKNYIQDVIYCNDLSNQIGGSNPYVGLPYAYGPSMKNGYWYSDGSIAFFWIKYNAKIRHETSKPTYICSNKNDKYTSDDIILGNGKLDYPLAAISYDEIFFSSGALGGYSRYLTMTPAFLMYGTSSVKHITQMYYSDGVIGDIYTNSVHQVRPVISIKGSTLVTGTGTKADPYNVIGDVESVTP